MGRIIKKNLLWLNGNPSENMKSFAISVNRISYRNMLVVKLLFMARGFLSYWLGIIEWGNIYCTIIFNVEGSDKKNALRF